VFNLHKLCAALMLHRLRMVPFWTPLVVILLRFHVFHIIFSSKANSDHDGGAGVVPSESSSVSIGDL
jgi:hypothetical protein